MQRMLHAIHSTIVLRIIVLRCCKVMILGFWLRMDGHHCRNMNMVVDKSKCYIVLDDLDIVPIIFHKTEPNPRPPQTNELLILLHRHNRLSPRSYWLKGPARTFHAIRFLLHPYGRLSAWLKDIALFLAYSM